MHTALVLGRVGHSVTSISASATTPTSFASLDSSGAVTFWDTRLPTKNYFLIEGVLPRRDVEPTELLFAPDQHLAVVLADNTLSVYDTRRGGRTGVYMHSYELMMFFNGPHPPGVNSTLVIDENGAIMSLNLKECAPTIHLSSHFFGREIDLPAPSFGSLPNICCGLGPLGSGQICALGMDGLGALYSDPLLPGEPFNVLNDICSSTGGQIINPPLPTTCGFYAEYVAVGRANGMYSILTLDETNAVVELLAAPGHASNGLCAAAWRGDGGLVTCSLCGEVSVWDVLPLLEEDPPEEDGTEGALPTLLAASSIREVTGQKSVVNCGAVLGCGMFAVGDVTGFVTLCPFV